MAHSYTPGLKVVARMRVRKNRVLPIKGDVLVERGATVTADTVVARTELPGDVYPINVANKLGIAAAEVKGAMLKQPGQWLEADEAFARATSFFGLFKSTVTTPKAARIEAISDITGQVILRGKPQPVQVAAYIPGEVVDVMPADGVVVESMAAFIQGIFGIGGEALGTLTVLAQTPSDVLQAEQINDAHKGCILVGGSLATAEALKKAEAVGAAGVVVGGFDDQDLRDYLGYDLGVAITGSEDIGITLIVTEGFGKIDMAAATFEMLASHDGRPVSINGATQIRAGVIRPEVVIPLSSAKAESVRSQTSQGMDIGSQVRCIRAPYFGRIGTITDLPAELVMLESETKVRVLKLDFGDGEQAVIPRANVELIELG